MAKSVLIYTNHFYPENFKVNEIVDALDEKGYKITVITGIPNYPSGKIYPNYGFFSKTKERKGNITIRRLPLIPRGKGSKIRLIINYLSYFFSVILYTLYLSIFRKRFDVIFVHHTSPILIAISPVVYKKIRRKTQLILWDLDIWPDTLSAVNVVKNIRILNIIEYFVKKIYNNYNHILVGSKSFVQIVQKRVKNVSVSYFPNWAEDVFTLRKIIPPAIEPQFSSNGLKIMFAGNMGEAQDIKTVYKAIFQLKNENITWIFLGEGRMKKWIENQVESDDLNAKVKFLGNYPIKFMPYFFEKADIMLVSLKDEDIFKKTVPAKVQAYMAFEKPILGMLSGEGAEIISEANCGWTVESGNFMKLVGLVKGISKYTEKELIEKGQNGKKYFDVHFSKNIRFTQLFNLIE